MFWHGSGTPHRAVPNAEVVTFGRGSALTSPEAERAGDGNRTRIASLEARPGVKLYELEFVQVEAKPGASPGLTARLRAVPPRMARGWHGPVRR
jgi:hypothetical protein